MTGPGETRIAVVAGAARRPRWFGVHFIRTFIVTTGILTIVCGLHFLAVVILRASAGIQPPRWVQLVATGAFIVSFICHGIAWVMVAMSERLWTTSL